MAWLIKAGPLNFLGLSFPLSCLGEMVSFIWATKFPLTLVFCDFVMFPYRCLGESLWQDAFAVPALSHYLSVCATTIHNPLVARKACVGSSCCVSSLPSGEERGGFDVVRMGSTFWPRDPSVPSGPRCQAVLCKNYLQWKKHLVHQNCQRYFILF